jgi:hypothetical protein
MEKIIYVLLALSFLVLLLGIVLFVLSRKKPEALIPLVAFLRRFSWFRKKSDKAALRAIAKNPTAIEEAEKMGSREMKALQKSLQGGSEKERLHKLERIQELSEKGDLQKAAEVMRERSKTPDEMRSKNKRKDKRRQKKKAARKQKRRSR